MRKMILRYRTCLAAAIVALSRNGADAPTKLAIIHALLAERQSSSNPHWGHILIAAFEPMLTDLKRMKLFGRDEDGAQFELEAFLDATLRVRRDAYVLLALQRLTD